MTTSATGVGSLLCEGDGVSTAGGYVLPEGTAAFASAQTLFAEEDGTEGFAVRLVRTDGTPYVGTVDLSLQCEYPGTAPTAGSTRTAASAKAGARLR